MPLMTPAKRVMDIFNVINDHDAVPALASRFKRSFRRKS